MRFRLPKQVLAETFAELRRCGRGERECQVLWVSPWDRLELITHVVHPKHRSHGDGFELDGAWLTKFWQDLRDTHSGIRVQVHTHPGRAFHSPTDDAWPIVHTPGFLSLVIPRFAEGPIGFLGVYLAKLSAMGSWDEVTADEYFDVT